MPRSRSGGTRRSRVDGARRFRNKGMTAAALPRQREGALGWSAAAMLAPASIVVAIGIVIPIVILFRYSLNQFTPAKMMVDAFTAENYVKFFTDPFYVAVLVRTIRVAATCTAICRSEERRVGKECRSGGWGCD